MKRYAETVGRSIRVVLLMSILSSMGLPALAQDETGDAPDYARRGFYVRAGAAVGFEDSVPPSSPADIDSMVGASFGVGYRAHPRLGIEGAFDWVRGDVMNRANGVTVGSWELWAITADLKGYLATGIIQPYGAIGLGVQRQTVSIVLLQPGSEVAFAPRFGGGIDVYLTESVGLNLDAGYLLGTGGLDNANAVTLRVGVIGRF